MREAKDSCTRRACPVSSQGHWSNSGIGKTNRVTNGLRVGVDLAKSISGFGVERQHSPFKQERDLPRKSLLQPKPAAALR